MERKSIQDAQIPEGISPVMKIEFNILKKKFLELESQWFRLLDNENPEQIRYGDIVDREYASMINQATELAKVRADSIMVQYNVKKAKILNDYEENKRLLFNRIMNGYKMQYNDLLLNLRELLGTEFEHFMSTKKEIDFPQIPANKNTERNISAPDDVKLSLSHNEVEKQIQRIHRSLEKTPKNENDS